MSTPAETLKRARTALAEGFLSEAYRLLNELCKLGEEVAAAGPELASAESYGVPEHSRQLFQDRIELVNRHLRGEP